MPDDGRGNRFAGQPIPKDDRLALVRDAAGRDLRGRDASLSDGGAGRLKLSSPNGHRILLDPARMGISAIEGDRLNGDPFSALVVKSGAGAGRTFIER